jgi:hypothetical protein
MAKSMDADTRDAAPLQALTAAVERLEAQQRELRGCQEATDEALLGLRRTVEQLSARVLPAPPLSDDHAL